MRFRLPKIYPITDVSITKLSHLEQVKKLAAGGATLIQLRDKHSAPTIFFDAAKSVIEFARPKNIKIIINDRVDIALAVKADGVHLGQDDLPPERARQILGNKAIIGFSTHTPAQALDALRLPIDYAAIGPVFPTSSKDNPDPIVGVENLRKVCEVVGNFPLVAIGGINFENALSVLQNGADSLAIIGAILTPAEKISANFSKFNQIHC